MQTSITAFTRLYYVLKNMHLHNSHLNKPQMRFVYEYDGHQHMHWWVTDHKLIETVSHSYILLHTCPILTFVPYFWVGSGLVDC